MNQPADPSFEPTDERAEGAHAPDPPAPPLAVELTGDLPCVVCRYNLRGLSIRAACPECGSPIRTTILARVDPRADELQSVRAPVLTSLALVVWPAAALLAAVAAWVLRASDIALVGPAAVDLHRAEIAMALIGATALSGLASAALIRPVRTMAACHTLAAACASLLYLPLIAVQWRLHLVLDPMYGAPYPPDAYATERFAWHAASLALVALIAILSRPNYAVFVERSRLLRSGRVGRQDILPLIAALAVAIVGDTLVVVTSVLTSDMPDALAVAATFLVGLGCMLFTIGLVSLTADALRIRPLIVRGAVALRTVLRTADPLPAKTGGADPRRAP